MGNDCCKRKEPITRDRFERDDLNKYLKNEKSIFISKKEENNSIENNIINSKFNSNGIKSILRDKYLEDSKKSELTNFKVKCQICEEKNKKLTYLNKSNENSSEELKFCTKCIKFFCENCWTEKHKEAEHKFIPYIQKSQKCLKHGKDLMYYCEDCEEKCCEDDKDHDKHEKKPIFIDNNILLAMIANQNKKDNNLCENKNDIMKDYIKNSLKNKIKFD